ncbi:ribosomal RNA small subunit methyltransferase A [Candidatus Parcubacteria bacterium]|nr:ribosomal RNA small subunit methyltransferase A [Candidatus Parcubacteria bacterium]
MDLLQKTKQICKDNNIKPARSRGQNFLISEKVYDKIIKAADLDKDDVVLEVGPGLGFLTEKLANKAKKVIAVELDDKLADVVEKRMKEQGMGNVKIVNENILSLTPWPPLLIRRGGSERSERGRGFKIVANLPYNITSIFLRKFLSAKEKPLSLILMLQKEVAERIVAKPGKPRQSDKKDKGSRGKMSLLAVSVQFYADAKIIDYVNKENFWPQPKVDSAIININTKKTKENEINEKAFFRLVKYGFSAKRKMLKNNLAAGYQIKPSKANELLKIAGFRENIRAQELSVENWLKLFGKIEENML